MPIAQADSKTKNAVLDILSIFLRDFEGGGRLDSSLSDKLYSRYPLGGANARDLESMLTNGPDVEMRDQNKFLHLAPTGERIFPFVTMQSSDNWVRFRIYALLTMLDDDNNLQALALRFETDEGDGAGRHDFCHAQLCIDINKHVKDISPSWFPVSQPSIPLDAKDQITLVLCMLTSIYGGRQVFTDIYTKGDRCLLNHLGKVRALHRP